MDDLVQIFAPTLRAADHPALESLCESARHGTTEKELLQELMQEDNGNSVFLEAGHSE